MFEGFLPSTCCWVLYVNRSLLFRMPITKYTAGKHDISTSQPECPICMADPKPPAPVKTQPKETKPPKTPPWHQTSIDSLPMNLEKKK